MLCDELCSVRSACKKVFFPSGLTFVPFFSVTDSKVFSYYKYVVSFNWLEPTSDYKYWVVLKNKPQESADIWKIQSLVWRNIAYNSSFSRSSWIRIPCHPRRTCDSTSWRTTWIISARWTPSSSPPTTSPSPLRSAPPAMRLEWAAAKTTRARRSCSSSTWSLKAETRKRPSPNSTISQRVPCVAGASRSTRWSWRKKLRRGRRRPMCSIHLRHRAHQARQAQESPRLFSTISSR